MKKYRLLKSKEFAMRLCRILGLTSSKSTGSKRDLHRVIPQFEALEDRLVPSIVTDYTQIAQMFPRHSVPTTLALNFDGWRDNTQWWDDATFGLISGDYTVSPYQSPNGTRDRDIQDILFRTSEYFAPFDVRVVELNGDGNHFSDRGDSTIFVGPNAKHHSFAPNSGSDPGADFPGNSEGFTHRPNSDDYDVAYVDSTNLSIDDIAKAIAHEAGHTFGLGHVRTDNLTDPAPLGHGYLPEIMSYTDSGTGFARFADRTEPLTAFNFDGGSTSMDDDVLPGWTTYVTVGGQTYGVPYYLKTQNSYQFLSAVLGSRPADDFANVVHATSVEYYTQPTAISPQVQTFRGGVVLFQVSQGGKLDRGGDYDVFSFTCARSGQVTISIPVADYTGVAAGYNPELMIYDANGDGNLMAYSAAQHPALNLNMNKGDQVFIVVGGHNGWIGNYDLFVRAPLPFNWMSAVPVAGMAGFATLPSGPTGPTSPLGGALTHVVASRAMTTRVLAVTGPASGKKLTVHAVVDSHHLPAKGKGAHHAGLVDVVMTALARHGASRV
jgi:hypothetical protein